MGLFNRRAPRHRQIDTRVPFIERVFSLFFTIIIKFNISGRSRRESLGDILIVVARGLREATISI